MSHALAAHPDREQLARFRRGALPPEEVEEIASHVDSCASCCSSLKEMPDDSLSAWCANPSPPVRRSNRDCRRT